MESARALHVLILEDEPGIRRGLTRVLQRAGHHVVAVERCSGARALERSFDVAVLDLELPDGSGLEIAGELLAHGAAHAVVFFSGAADASLIERASQLGEVVSKSAALDYLLEAIVSSRPAQSSAVAARGFPRSARSARR